MAWKSLVKNSTYDRCIVLVAETDKTSSTGFKVSELRSWEETWVKFRMEDPDGFSVYSNKTGNIEEVTYPKTGEVSKVWRIHDGTWVDVVDKDGKLIIVAYKLPTIVEGPNTKYGRYGLRKESGSLKPEHYGFPTPILKNSPLGAP